jgi:zona occludens toxin
MINLLLGAPGGGKSYEAVAFHVIPALSKGRKVITNLPLELDQYPPEWRDLVEVRGSEKVERVIKGQRQEVLKRPFSEVADFGDTWRHPDKGFGALYVIDECHLSLSRDPKTPVAVAEWFSMHRHELCDVLLISQSYGKIDKDICDMVQTVYRVRKAVALGSSNKYIRKVFDGLKGDNVNTSIRTYDSKYFKYYKSHTKSESGGSEEGANDIVPIWKRWPFIGAAACLVIVLFMATRTETNPIKAGVSKNVVANANKPGGAAVARSAAAVGGVDAVPPPVSLTPAKVVEGGSQPVGVSKAHHPLAGYGVHIGGSVQSAAKGQFYVFQISQNGQVAYAMNSLDMKEAGYAVTRMNDCLAKLKFGDEEFTVMCDAPRLAIAPGAGGATTGTQEAHAAQDGGKIVSVNGQGYGVVGGHVDGVRVPGHDSASSAPAPSPSPSKA